MSSIIELKGNLFDYLNKEDIFLQACNGQGNWGAGIAKDFARHFPLSYYAHQKKVHKVGDGYLLQEDGYQLGCIITSKFYGKRKDSPREILINTYVSIIKLINSIDSDIITIQSPKINSGLFATPWDKTARVIQRAMDKFEDKDITWITREL